MTCEDSKVLEIDDAVRAEVGGEISEELSAGLELVVSVGVLDVICETPAAIAVVAACELEVAGDIAAYGEEGVAEVVIDLVAHTGVSDGADSVGDIGSGAAAEVVSALV